MHASKRRFRGHTQRGYSLLEVLVALAILLVGIIGILQFFPPSLRASNEASLKGRAALLAQSKAEEIRRDSDADGVLIDTITGLGAPTDTVPFLEDPNLVYRFHSESLRVTDGDPTDPEFAPNVARVIVGYNDEFRPDGKILYELRFDGGPGIGFTPTPSPTPSPTPCAATPPSLIAPDSNANFLSTPGLAVYFEWTAVTDAVSYLILIENLDDPAWGFQVITVGSGTTSALVGPPQVPEFTSGRYIWAVRPNVAGLGCDPALLQSPGDLFTIDGGGVTPTPSPSPSPTPCTAVPPLLVEPPSNADFVAAPGLAIDFEWTAVTGATAYDVLIENLNDTSWGPQTITVGGGITATSIGPPQVPDYTLGQYIWAVRPQVPNCDPDDLQTVGDLFNVN